MLLIVLILMLLCGVGFIVCVDCAVFLGMLLRIPVAFVLTLLIVIMVGCGIAGLRVLVCCWFALWLLGCGCMWLVLCCMDGLFCVVGLIVVNLLC